MTDTFARMRQLIGTPASWLANDLVIGDGEIAVEKQPDGSVKIKFGNGSLPYSLLPYFIGTGSPLFGFAFTKTPVVNKPLATFDSPAAWMMPAGLAGAQGTIIANDTATAGPPSAQTDFAIHSPLGTNIGTMRFAAGALMATFIFSGNVSVLLGQMTQIVCPASLNGMTGAITGSIVGTR